MAILMENKIIKGGYMFDDKEWSNLSNSERDKYVALECKISLAYKTSQTLGMIDQSYSRYAEIIASVYDNNYSLLYSAMEGIDKAAKLIRCDDQIYVDALKIIKRGKNLERIIDRLYSLFR